MIKKTNVAYAHDGSSHHSDTKRYDVFKDSLLRYAGYTNEVGEAFRAFVPKSVVVGTYVVASVYALGDAVHKGYWAYTDPANQQSSKKRIYETIEKSADTAIWQTAASVVLPAVAVNRTVKTTQLGLQTMSLNKALAGKLSPGMMKWIPTLIGLNIIPVLPYIIDPAVDFVMDWTTRPLMKKFKPQISEGEQSSKV